MAIYSAPTAANVGTLDSAIETLAELINTSDTEIDDALQIARGMELSHVRLRGRAC